jgi:hypothetical protein
MVKYEPPLWMGMARKKGMSRERPRHESERQKLSINVPKKDKYFDVRGGTNWHGKISINVPKKVLRHYMACRWARYGTPLHLNVAQTAGNDMARPRNRRNRTCT